MNKTGIFCLALIAVIAIINIMFPVAHAQRGRSRYGPNWADRLVGPNGEIIDNEIDGSWDFNGARVVVGSINLVAYENDIVYYENEAVFSY